MAASGLGCRKALGGPFLSFAMSSGNARPSALKLFSISALAVIGLINKWVWLESRIFTGRLQ